MTLARHRAFASALWFGLLLSSFAGQSLADDPAKYESHLERLKASISGLQQQLSGARSERDRLQAQLQKAETEIGELYADISRLSTQLQAQQRELQGQQQRKKQLLQARHDQQQAISQQISSAYRLGHQSHLKLLLNLQDPGQWARLGTYHRYLLAARADKIDQFLATVKEIDQLSQRIQAETLTLQANQERLQRRHTKLAAAQEERKSTVARLDKDILTKDQQLQAQLQDRKRLQQLLEEVTRAMIANLAVPGDGKSFRQRRGNMALPVKGKLLKKFGQAKVAGKLNWEGVLITADAGAEVNAIHHGQVVFSDYLRGQGLLLIIDHGDGYMSLYAHNQTLLKGTGEWVSAGELIARVGNTGGQGQNALYFEIRHRGKPTDPASWCRQG